MTRTFDDLIQGVARAARGEALFDADMRYLAASATWLADHKLTESVIGRSLYEGVANVCEDWRAVHRRCLAGATERSDGARVEHGGGKWVAWEVRPWRDGRGAIRGVVIASEDITARVEARESPAQQPELRPAAGPSMGALRAIGARIASVRFRLDRTERDFARLLGVPRAAVSAWEGGWGFDGEDLRRIAERTDTSFEWLAGGLTGAAASSARGAGDVEQSFPDDGRIEPVPTMTDEPPPPPVCPEWDFRVAPSTTASPATRPRPSGLYLPLPGATALSGARGATYRVVKRGRMNDAPGFLLSLVLLGRRRFEQMGREFEGEDGSAVFSSSAEDGRFFYRPGGRYLSVFVPAKALRQRVREIESHVMQPIAPQSAPLRLLSAYVSGLMKSGTALDREAAHSVADHLVDLCALLLGATGDERALAETRGLRAAQRSAIRDAIEADAATPGFSAQTVAARLNVSPRYVHFLLEEGGAGFGSLVTARRLDVVRARLADREFAGMTIPEIATACGFADLQRFQLQFVSRFGDKAAAFRARR